MKLLDKFLNQPIYVRIVEIWLMVVLIVLGIANPWFTATLVLGVLLGLSIIFLIIYFFLVRSPKW